MHKVHRGRAETYSRARFCSLRREASKRSRFPQRRGENSRLRARQGEGGETGEVRVQGNAVVYVTGIGE